MPGVDVLAFDLPHRDGPSSCLHLMSLLSPLDRDLVVAFVPLVPVRLMELLDERGVDVVPVPDEEFSGMGPNVLALAPRVAVALEGNPETRRRMERAGVEVFAYEGSEISHKGEGGPTCLTRAVLRAGLARPAAGRRRAYCPGPREDDGRNRDGAQAFEQGDGVLNAARSRRAVGLGLRPGRRGRRRLRGRRRSRPRRGPLRAVRDSLPGPFPASTSRITRTRSTGREVAASGQRFAFAKATEGRSFVDPTLRDQQVQRAKPHGLVFGAYHFARPDDSANDAVARGRPLRRPRRSSTPAT